MSNENKQMEVKSQPVELIRIAPKKGDARYTIRLALNPLITLNTKNNELKESFVKLLCYELGIATLKDSTHIKARTNLFFGNRSDSSTYHYIEVILSESCKVNLFLDGHQEVILKKEEKRGKAYKWELKEIPGYEFEEQKDDAGVI